MTNSHSRGVTLIELMAVIAIVALLSMFAYPSYQGYINESARTEAHANLLKAFDAQERYYLSKNEYGSMNNIGVSPTATSDNYEYRVKRTNSNQNFLLRAIARASQADDTDCPIIYIDDAGAKTPAGCW